MPEKVNVSLEQKLRQELRLTPQMVQSMEVLQMNSQDLLEYIAKAAEENPVLEREEAAALFDEYRQLRSRAGWLDAGVTPGSGVVPERGAVDRELESLSAFLRDQLERLGLERQLLALCRYLAELVDEDGYLQQEDMDSLRELELPAALIDRAVEVLQSLEPAGVAARDLSECLLLQLRRQGEKDRTVLTIVKKHLSRLGKHQYGALSRLLGVSEKEIRAAEERIAGLDPHPGRAFQPAEQTEYVRPDVFVVELDEGYQVVLNEYYLPRLLISPYYSKLIESGPDAETAAYLRQKMRQANSLLYSLSQRGATLRRCAEAVLQHQKSFFEGEDRELLPMTLKELAAELTLHPSTVTRCVQGKYLQCRQGTYPLRYFFSLPAGGVSRQAVQQKLLQLIRDEDGAHPLSDEKLCRLLAEQGVEISRRAVAKYRAELGIPAAAGRRKKGTS